MIFFALPFENFQSQQKEKMEFITITGKVAGEMTHGVYKTSYLTAVEYSIDTMEVTICYYGKFITYKMTSLEDVTLKGAELQKAMQEYHNQRSKK